MRIVNAILAIVILIALWRFAIAMWAQRWYTDRIAECDKAHYTCEQFHAMATVSPWYVKLESKLRKRGV